MLEKRTFEDNIYIYWGGGYTMKTVFRLVEVKKFMHVNQKRNSRSLTYGEGLLESRAIDVF